MCKLITTNSNDIKQRINFPSQELTHGQLFVLARVVKEGHKPLIPFTGTVGLPSFLGHIVLFLTFKAVLKVSPDRPRLPKGFRVD